MMLAVEMKVKGVVITSSPGPISLTKRERNKAAVPEETETACLVPI